MKRTTGAFVTIALAALQLYPSAALVADNLTGATSFLCAAVEVIACYEDGECLQLPPWELNIPRFIEIDLKAGTLGTTEASGQNRSTPIKNLEREAGQIVLQGSQGGRAFSFLIDEKTGAASIAIAREGLVVAVFSACTSMPRSVAAAGKDD